MTLPAWLLIAGGLSSPLLTAYFAGAEMGAAGYASGTGYLLSIVGIVLVIVQTRSMPSERRGRMYMMAAIVVVALNAWSSLRILNDAGIEREVAAARPQIDAIMQAAATEAVMINTGQIGPGDVSPGWQPYAAVPAIELGDAAFPLRMRFIEMMRRAKSRELDLARKVRNELDASGVANALSHERLMSAQARADSLARVERYRTFMQSYAEQLTALNEQALTDIRALGLPRASEEEMARGRARAARESAPAFQQFVDRELKAIDAIQAVIRLVDAHSDTVRVTDGKLTFSDPAAQAEYQAMVSRLGLTDG